MTTRSHLWWPQEGHWKRWGRAIAGVLYFHTVYASAAPGTADYKPKVTCSVPNTPSNVNELGKHSTGDKSQADQLAD